MMKDIPIEVMLMADECKYACANEPDFEQRCRKAMRKVVGGFYMLAGNGPREQDLCFRGAIGGVMLDPLTTADEKQGIHNTLEQLRALAGLMNGLPMDVEAMAKRADENPPLPLMKWWHDERDKTKKADPVQDPL